MRLPRLISFHPILFVVLLVISPKIAVSDELDISRGELNTNEFNTDVDEPAIELPEAAQKRNPFRNVSQGVRKESQDPLVVLTQQAVDTTARRMLSTKQHTPWQMMHALLGVRHDFQLLHGDETVSGLEWICEGQTFDNEYWFEQTKFGGRAHPYNRPYAFEGHANQFLAILSMCGVELDQEFGTANGPITMRGMIEHAKMSLDLEKDEPTWTLWALSRYLPPDSRWRNYKGEMWSIERLVQEQTARPMAGAPCGGTHSLFALAHARNVYLRQGKPLRGVWLQAEYKIRKYINAARMQQNSNGTLSSNYFRGRQYNPDFNKRMASAGHVLEFLMIALPQEELQSRWVRRAIEATASDLMRNRKAYVKCSPLYHSVNALNIYLDRVNPRSAPEIATADEAPRTAMLEPKRIKEATEGLKRVPAMGISQTHELPPVVKSVEEGSAPKAESSTSVVAVPAVGDEPRNATSSVPILDRKAKDAAVLRDREKWVATAPERRGEIVLEGDEDITTTIDETPVPAKVAQVEEAAPVESEMLELRQVPQKAIRAPLEEAVEATPADVMLVEPVVDEPTVPEPAPTTELELEPEPDNAAEVEPEAATVKKEDASAESVGELESDSVETEDSSSVPVLSVSLPKALESMEPVVTEITEGVTSDADQKVVEFVKPFVSSHHDTENLVDRFEGPDREVALRRSAVAAAAGFGAGQVVADVGAGTGLFLKTISDAVGVDGQVFAIEVSPQLVEHLDERVSAEKLGNVQVVRNDSRSLQLMTTRIDKAFLCDTYHELEYPQELLASIFKALRSGGELIIVDFDRDVEGSGDWVLEHVRADKKTFRNEIEDAGFEFVHEVHIPGLDEHFLMTFRRPGI